MLDAVEVHEQLKMTAYIFVVNFFVSFGLQFSNSNCGLFSWIFYKYKGLCGMSHFCLDKKKTVVRKLLSCLVVVPFLLNTTHTLI